MLPYQVILHQPYNPSAQEPRERPFVLILQTDFMLEMARRFSLNSAWAVDSTFKTNKYGLPLYAGVVPNQKGNGIPIWFMLCSKDPGERHEHFALEITFATLFSRLGNIRPRAIIIDKSQVEFNAIYNVIRDDPSCWDITHTTQLHCHVLLCWFHAKKAWVEHLLPKVPEGVKDELYAAMCGMMYSPTLQDFNARYAALLDDFSAYGGVGPYVTNGWCGPRCQWRRMWPRFGRLFPHGGMETTNLVERLWQHIKYTLLDGQINRNIRDLLIALVGDAKTGTRMGGTLHEFFKQKQEIGKCNAPWCLFSYALKYSFSLNFIIIHQAADSDRFANYGNSRSHTTRLQGAVRIVERYKSDPGSIVLVCVTSLLFKVRSEMHQDFWYHVCFQTMYCDCPDIDTSCKHLRGVRMVAEEYFPLLRPLLPIIDQIHTLVREDDYIVPDNELQGECCGEVTLGSADTLDDILHVIGKLRGNLSTIEDIILNGGNWELWPVPISALWVFREPPI